MRAVLVFLVFLGWTAFARYDVVCRMLDLCNENADLNAQQNNVIDIERTNDLDFVVNDSVLLEGYDQFAFQEFQFNPILNDNNNAYLKGVLAYLNENPNTQMTITGRLWSSEKDSLMDLGFNENLGMARADALRNWFVEKGINSDRISLDSKIDDNALSQPISFSAISNDERPDDYNVNVKPKYTFTNMTFSEITFEYNSDEFVPNQAFENYADSVKTYLLLPDNLEKSITIIGHTDNKGKAKYNKDLGKRRAKAALKYLVKSLEMPIDRINIDSKGHTEPIATNETEEGREKNRRVNIVIK